MSIAPGVCVCVSTAPGVCVLTYTSTTIYVLKRSFFGGRQLINRSSGFFSLFAVHLVTQQLLDIVLFVVISQK